MNYIKSIFKISIVLLLLLISVGSIYAADDACDIFSEDDGVDDDFELDEDLDDNLDDEDDDFELDEDLDDSDYEDLDDEDLDDFDDDEDDDLDYEDLDDGLDDNISDDYAYSDFDFLKTKITFYLNKYGNCSDHNWTQSEEFLSQYQGYLSNPDIYKLNESSQGYETYLKIYDSIVSTFDGYNLTENETAYLKFMVIFYLNNYGNVSANYTWDDNESFANFTLPKCFILGAICDTDIFKAIAAACGDSDYLNSFNPVYASLNNSTDVNQTSTGNQTYVHLQEPYDFNIFVFLLAIVLVVLIMI